MVARTPELTSSPVRLISDTAAVDLMCYMFHLYQTNFYGNHGASQESFDQYQHYRDEVMRRLRQGQGSDDPDATVLAPAYTLASTEGRIMNQPDFGEFGERNGYRKNAGTHAWNACKTAFISRTLPLRFQTGTEPATTFGRPRFDRLADLELTSLVGSVALVTERVMLRPSSQTYHRTLGWHSGPATLGFLQELVVDQIGSTEPAAPQTTQ